ncbi:PREDICTED: protocadherin alpha-13-like [Nanorana parkeri]|uniref:protocadherin alpha-13-like n=1 Tax=Nanorana parkeri TaxID=125878 RepID=UPI0008542DCA|nr:PREDICTED: protocadherin alpha-13-like [Nanorana parkeri]
MVNNIGDYEPRSWLVNFILLQMSWDLIFCQLHYVIPEESKHGTFVGRIAQDLGLDMGEINSRMLRVVSRDDKEYFQVNLQNGILFVNNIIDRENVCPDTPFCIIPLQIIVDKPVQIYHVEVEIEDINDNSPVFSTGEYNLLILELKPAGSRFPLEGAIDADVGINTITNYELSESDYFTLDFQKYLNQIRTLELVLKKPLDREKLSIHNLTLISYDGGKPRLSGTTHIIVTVEDVNDNSPQFDQPFYQCSIAENAVLGTLVIKLKATDLDQGKNGEITYTFSKLLSPRIKNLFKMDPKTGDIKLVGSLDYETVKRYEISIDAFDHGDNPMVGHCKVLVTVVDVNDNPPEMTVTSLLVPVPEDSPKGTIIAIISVHDKDSGSNGKVNCRISDHTPFKIIPSFMGDFSLTVDAPLDRERKSVYEIVISATDEGFPPFSAAKTVKIDISDINDNIPQFIQPVDTIFIKENNPPGFHVYTASGSDMDIGQNAFITYTMTESTVDGVPISSYISVNPENGKVFALLSFDHEQVAYFQCHIRATDAGLPPLSSNLTLNIFIEDINDNAPLFLSNDLETTIKTSKTAHPRHLVTKVRALDLDSGYNAWISYSFRDSTVRAPFVISQQTGEISLKRALTDSDNDEYRLVLLAQDHGEPIMTAQTQITISFVESGEEIKLDPQESNGYNVEFSEANVYLVIAICIISSIFLITLIAFTVLRWHKYREEVNDLKESYKVCSNTGGSWMYSQESQYQFYLNSVQPRNDLMVFTPNSSQNTGNENAVGEAVIVNSSKSSIIAFYVLFIKCEMQYGACAVSY